MVWETRQDIEIPHGAVELKLVHNNKNWESQVNAAWRDLFPTLRSKKELLRPGLPCALLGVLGKNYQEDLGAAYPQRKADKDLFGWQSDLWAYALPLEGHYAGRLREAWSGRRHPIEERSPNPADSNFFQLYLLVRGDS